MKVKVGIQLGASNSPLESFWDVVDECERLGFDSLWLSERISGRLPDSLTALGAIAGRTQRLKFGTSVLVAPAYNPVLLAKMLATLDVLSGGRVLPAVGLGQDDPRELEALGLRKAERGRRLDEAIRLMKLLWTQERASFEGEFYQVHDFTLWPRPVGPLPNAVWVGGSSDAALRRAGRLCDGWLPSSRTPAEVAAGVHAIQEYATQAGRAMPDDHFGALIPMSYDSAAADQLRQRRPELDPREFAAFGNSQVMVDLARRYIDAGASKLVILPVTAGDLRQLGRLKEEVAAPLEG